MNITVIGAGSWGTALALHFAQHGHRISLWSRNTEHMQTLRQDKENKRYLPGFAFPDTLSVHTDLQTALTGSDLVLIVTSVAGLRDSIKLLV